MIQMSKENKIEQMKKEIKTALTYDCSKARCLSCKHINEENCEPAIIADHLIRIGYVRAEWISVESGLPEDGDYITFTNATGKNNGVIPQKLVTTTVRGKTVRRWEWNYRISPWTVTHYMPLPEPPETKGETE